MTAAPVRRAASPEAAEIGDILDRWRARARRFEIRERVSDAAGLPRVYLVQSGWLARVHTLSTGSRQITALLLPGDHWASAGPLTSAEMLLALRPASVASIPWAEVQEAKQRCEPLRRWFAQEDQRRLAMLENKVVSLGRRSAVMRMAHLMCELLVRSGAGASPARMAFPLTQADMADILGLSVVHTNRSLQTLRGTGLAQVNRGLLTVADFPALARMAEFDGDYLAEPLGDLAERH